MKTKNIMSTLLILCIVFLSCSYLRNVNKKPQYEPGTYPNPFSPSTRFYLKLPSRQFVNMKMYDVTGKEIYTMLNDTLDKGEHVINIDTSLAGGVYFVRYKTEDSTYTKKFILMK
jgi:hypothetical protein